MAPRAEGPERETTERTDTVLPTIPEVGTSETHAGESERVARARHAASEKLEEAAQRVRRLGDLAAEKNERLERTRPLAQNAAARIETAAGYLRSHELNELPDDLESAIRRHPLTAVGVAFFAGYMLRRIF